MDQQIVLAKLDDERELLRERRTDLGERPIFLDVKLAKALMWRNSVKPSDLTAEKARARAFITREPEWHMFVYPVSEKDPMNRAKFDVLAKFKVGKDRARVYRAR